MEILVLIMLYYLTQNTDFEKTVNPLMSSLKDSEQLLKFMNDLSKFSELFAMAKPQKESGVCENARPEKGKPEPNPYRTEKENACPPHEGEPTDPIANDFIRTCLEKYFQKR